MELLCSTLQKDGALKGVLPVDESLCFKIHNSWFVHRRPCGYLVYQYTFVQRSSFVDPTCKGHPARVYNPLDLFPRDYELESSGNRQAIPPVVL
jgi:hypothetical protein